MPVELRFAALSLILALSRGSQAFGLDTSGDCAVLVPPDETLGETMLCGQITVPEDWEAPGGKTIGMSYAILKAKSLAPFKDPVIYFQGGPGGSGLNSLSLIAAGTEQIRANRDVIVFDTRGTAHSNDLYCPYQLQVTDPENHEANIKAADARIDALKISAYSDPDAVFEAIANYWKSIDRGRCVPYFKAQGIDLTQYNTANTVRDVITMMEELGYPAYNLFGGSYGTTVVLGVLERYNAADAAELPKLRAAVIDGVAPRNRAFYEQGFISSYVALGVLEDCEANTACRDLYPDIRQKAVSLLARLHETPLKRDDGEDITADDLAEILRAAVSNQQKLVPYLPRLIAELDQGETATFDFARSVMHYEIVLPDPPPPAPPAREGLASAVAELDGITKKFEEIKEGLSVDLLSNTLIRESMLEASTHPELFMAIFHNYTLVGGGSVGNILAAKLQPYSYNRALRTREGLVDFVKSTVSFPVLQGTLLDLAADFSDEEIGSVFDNLTGAAFERGMGSVDAITHRVVTCNDEAPWISNEVAFEAYARFETPQMIGTAAYWPANYQISCQQLGLAAESYSPPPPGVKSDLPTLVINGGLDGMTPPEWGNRAAQTLSQSKVVTIPMAGHTAGLLNKCGNALVAAFVLDPEAEINTACADAARPSFVQPDSELPE